MSKHLPVKIQMIPIDRVDVLNPRERNGKVFEEIVGNIKTIGLKKPITVTPRKGPDGEERYLLVCGEGRLKAFKSAGEAKIPALIVRRDVAALPSYELYVSRDYGDYAWDVLFEAGREFGIAPLGRLALLTLSEEA